MESTNPYRLPRTVTPDRYALTLRPDIDQATFAGTVVIAATAHERAERITMNAIELTVRSVKVTANGTLVEATPRFEADSERLHLDLAEAVTPGPVQIEIEFEGILNDKLRGFYRSSFTDDDGVEHTIATTQFESTNARRCFPCWDEPDHKAAFDVTLEVPEHMLAISAMAEIERTPIDQGVRVRFAPTPPMSTYLLAFVVGELEASEAIDVDGVPVRIVHRPGAGDSIAFAHDAAAFCLKWLTDYFGVPYFGDKIDLVAIPDFAFGAMENTGCVTFREVLLLVDPETTTQPEQQRSVAVIAHELAHMWFGNLVTMKWWEGLWLKEAFATFMETAATDAYRPDWRVWEGFALERSAAFAVDALHSTRPVEYEVLSPADAEGMYDVLTYEKGASVVRMLEQHVGADAFRAGIQSYMETHALGNTVTSDLWNSIGSATGEPVAEIMHEWINQGGFPLIGASLSADEVTLDQRRFQFLANGASGDAATWQVPVAVRTGQDASLLLAPGGRVTLSDLASTVVVDPDSHGFFRVRYDSELSGRLAAKLMDLTSSQRYRLFDDLFDLVLADQAKVEEFLELGRALTHETSPPVWSAVLSGFSTLAHVASTPEQQATIGRHLAEIASPELEWLGTNRPPTESDPLRNEVRASLYSALGSLSRTPEIVEHARGLFENYDSSSNASILSAAVRVTASNGDRADYDEMYRRFQDASSPQIERRYLFALSRFDDADAIAELCERALDNSIRSQDAAFVLGLSLGNRSHGPQVWDFIEANWERIGDAVPDNAIGRMLSGVSWLIHHESYDRIHEFLEAHPVPQARLAISQHRERLDIHVRLRDRLAAELHTT